MIKRSALPQIIQGGMGVAVSDWKLARAVSVCGQLGVVSGTALDTVFIRRLQDGDPGGHMRRAIRAFPIEGVGDFVLQKFFRAEGREPGMGYQLLPMHRQRVRRERSQITMLANFVEVFLAKEGHEGIVGINLLTKVQTPTLASLYGAMLARVDYVLMGAGIPREIPGALDALAEHRTATIRFDVEGLPSGESQFLTLEPAELGADTTRALYRPSFIPIISAESLAASLARKANGPVQGFVVEGPTAGGHNAPPRGRMQLNDRGEPVYGERDHVDLAKLAELGLPFWLAGGTGSPERLSEALSAGAAGIQVGTLFAFADESGFASHLKHDVLDHARRGEVDVVTDPRASPTGYPFKVVRWPGDTAESVIRERNCDLGYLRVAFRRDDGRIDYRCAAEPVADYIRKGGLEADTVGRRCLCNALTSNIGQPQLRNNGELEPPLLTSGDDLVSISRFLNGRERYSARDVIDYLIAGATVAVKPESEPMKEKSSIDASWTVNDVIETFPESILVLNTLGVDSCCGGNLTLSEACAEGGLDVATVTSELTRSISSEPAVR
jgi:NAD(P)H-dependent flavin oxidoreductase YrpB (nitropropane dioxygenase family)